MPKKQQVGDDRAGKMAKLFLSNLDIFACAYEIVGDRRISFIDSGVLRGRVPEDELLLEEDGYAMLDETGSEVGMVY
jgi:hypothetical protein